MPKRTKKLTLSRETLTRLEGQIGDGNDSCADSCYLVSCDGGCGISTALKG